MRILIADDSERVRQGVVELVSAEDDWEVVGEATDGEEALQKARELKPDLILLDISMPRLNGLDAARILRQDIPNARIVLMSNYDPVLLRPNTLGVHGCVDKSRLASDLVRTIQHLSDSATTL